MKILLKSVLIALASLSIVSCSSMMSLTSLTAQVAGASGLISEETASSIVSASDSIAKANEAITPEQEYYIGRAVAGTILEKYKVYSDKEMEKYLNEIVRTLAVNSSKPTLYKGYSVAILDTNEMNAFASSGGHIMVTKGLIKSTKSEDELAAVLAHELSHIHLNHGVKAIKSGRTADAILKTTSAAASTVLNDKSGEFNELVSAFDEGIGEIVTTMVNSGYSQKSEFDADSNALKLLSGAGYNPYAMKQMLATLKANCKVREGFGKTHPDPETRLNKISTKLSSYRSTEISEGRKARFERIAAKF